MLLELVNSFSARIPDSCSCRGVGRSQILRRATLEIFQPIDLADRMVFIHKNLLEKLATQRQISKARVLDLKTTC